MWCCFSLAKKDFLSLGFYSCFCLDHWGTLSICIDLYVPLGDSICIKDTYLHLGMYAFCRHFHSILNDWECILYILLVCALPGTHGRFTIQKSFFLNVTENLFSQNPADTELFDKHN